MNVSYCNSNDDIRVNQCCCFQSDMKNADNSPWTDFEISNLPAL